MTKPSVTAEHRLSGQHYIRPTEVRFTVIFDHDDTDSALRNAKSAYDDIVQQINRSRPTPTRRDPLAYGPQPEEPR